MMTARLILLSMCSFFILDAMAQKKPKPEDTEFYTPVPKVVDPGKQGCGIPSDAIALFDGKSLDQWVSAKDPSQPAGWDLVNGLMRVNKKAGDIETKQKFQDYQLHLEWRVPENITGSGQGRGNSGVYLAAIDGGGYEVQIMDSYNNSTYVNGQAGSVYKQYVPLANPIRPPGEWNYYDIVWTAPRFKSDGSLDTPARVTVLFNGIVVQNNVALRGTTEYIGQPKIKAHGPAPILLQAHGDPSEPISFRNIWLRPL